MSEPTRIALCVDCVMAHAGVREAPDSAEWTGFLPEWHGFEFAPAWDRAHLCPEECLSCDKCVAEAERLSEPYFVRPGRRCDGCGSGLGGDRWDYFAVDLRGNHPVLAGHR